MLEVNSIEDHVHLLAKIKPSSAVSEFVGKLKSNSSRWIKERFNPSSSFQWQSGFSSFSVSESSAGSVKTYIQNQREHHREVTFEEELKAFLDRHKIGYSPKHFLD